MRVLYPGTRALTRVAGSGRSFGWVKTQDIIKPVLRTCIAQMNSNSSSNSTVLEKSRVKFDRMLDRSTIYHLDQFSAKSPTPISIKKLVEESSHTTQKESFKFITNEIPIRLANMIMELKLMPNALSVQPQFQEILLQYIQSFKDLLVFATATFNPDTNKKFVVHLKEIRLRHYDTVPSMAAAIQGMMTDDVEGKMNQENIQFFLDRLYTNRISIHLLISIYEAVKKSHEKGCTDRSRLFDTIDPQCDIISVARDAYDDAAFMCDREFQEHPELEIEGRDISKPNKTVEEVRMSYLPKHLRHIFFEIFKNAMRASMEESKKKKLLEPSPVKCLVTKSEGDISIRVSDLGGGISREVVDKVLLYNFSTAEEVAKDKNCPMPGSGTSVSHAHPMHGLGYGLPLSRVYARYFKGDLNIISMHGLGSDVYIYLKAISDDAKECLPKYSIQTANIIHKNNKGKVSDWTS